MRADQNNSLLKLVSISLNDCNGNTDWNSTRWDDDSNDDSDDDVEFGVTVTGPSTHVQKHN